MLLIGQFLFLLFSVRHALRILNIHYYSRLVYVKTVKQAIISSMKTITETDGIAKPFRNSSENILPSVSFNISNACVRFGYVNSSLRGNWVNDEGRGGDAGGGRG